MENFDVKYMIFTEELHLLWFIEDQISEKSRNEHFSLNHQINQPNDIQILKFIYE